jgi:catechol 2,3-dioxygenase-like lactoylglutathione lyase family enzyme
MGYHHLAFATDNIEATHAFYTEVMGFRLVKAVANDTPDGGWAKHVFYDTGGGELLAFWDLHDEAIPPFNPSISEGLGLPQWVNHVAFAASSVDDLEARRDQLVERGQVVAEIDHGWCRSIYVTDPNRILVEFCVSTADFTAADEAEAARVLADPSPTTEPGPRAVLHGLPTPARS